MADAARQARQGIVWTGEVGISMVWRDEAGNERRKMEKLKIVKARGCYCWDSTKKKYLDFTSGGIFAGIFGMSWDHPLPASIRKGLLVCCYNAHYDNPASDRYKGMLREWTGFESVCLFSTGAEATEAFWRACRVYTGKPGIWGGLINPDHRGWNEPNPAFDSMHGVTLGALVMAGKMSLPDRKAWAPLGADLFGQEPTFTCGMIMEPYHAPSAQFHTEYTITKIADKHKTYPDIPLCLDEVQGGFGRTGKKFAYEWYDGKIKPDFITAGKAMGGGFPLSALLGPKAILEDPRVIELAHLHSTHSGHPVMASAGIKVLEVMIEQDLVHKVNLMGPVLEQSLQDCGVRYHAGKGLLAGLEFDKPETARAVVGKCRDKGLLVCDTGREWVKIGPAYIITEEQIREGCRIIKEAIGEVFDEQQSPVDSKELERNS